MILKWPSACSVLYMSVLLSYIAFQGVRSLMCHYFLSNQLKKERQTGRDWNLGVNKETEKKYKINLTITVSLGFT